MKKMATFGILGLFFISLVAGAYAFSNAAGKEALESGDYAAWKEAMTAGLTKERFEKMRERHGQMQEKRAEIEAAIEQGYEAWKEVVADSPKGNHMAEVVTEENFEKFVQMHEGDHETAKALAEELGLKRGRGKFCFRGE